MKRPAILVAAIVAFVVLGKLLLEDVLGLDIESLAAGWLADPGVGAATVIVGLLAVDVFLPVPSSVVMVLSGAAFGVMPGAALALLGSVGGEWLGFELVRRYGRQWSRRLVGDEEVERLNGFFERYGALAVIVTRPLPIVMETMSIVAGLSTMRRATFVGSSLVGTIPIVLAYAYAGARSREVGNILPAAIMLVAVSGAGWLVYRARVRVPGAVSSRSRQ